MVWHTFEGVSSIDQWIGDKGIIRLEFRNKLHLACCEMAMVLFHLLP